MKSQPTTPSRSRVTGIVFPVMASGIVLCTALAGGFMALTGWTIASGPATDVPIGNLTIDTSRGVSPAQVMPQADTRSIR